MPPIRPDRRGWRGGPGLAVSTFAGLSHTAPRLHCPTAINARVAIPYRAGRAIGKFGTVKRNRRAKVVRFLLRKMRASRRTSRPIMPTDLIPGAVFGVGARDHQFAYGVASLAPSGDGIKDDFHGNRSHLSELQI